jgi:transketolase
MDSLPSFPADAKGMATRIASGVTLAALAGVLPELIGGSADLTPSNKTDIPGESAFSVENRAGRYLHFGVREHAMGGILSGIALHGGLIPYGGTFLIFSDYMRPAIRLAALMGVGVIYVFTHDSIGLGEDGPTHQPIEHLAALRAIPNLSVIRPADANEAVHAWRLALERRDGPTALALTRQNLPVLDRSRFASAEGVERGAYVLADRYPEGAGRARELDVILMASGSEVDIIVRAAEELVKDGLGVRLVSFPSWDRFLLQSEEYRRSVFPSEVRARVSVEAASPLGWEGWIGESGEAIGLHRFGASAPYQDIYRGLGLTPERVVEAAQRSRERAAAIGVRS